MDGSPGVALINRGNAEADDDDDNFDLSMLHGEEPSDENDERTSGQVIDNDERTGGQVIDH